MWRLLRRRGSSPRPGRRLVVGDVHGCAATMRALLGESLVVEPGDHIYLLGDLISKGPDSLGVLQYVADLMEGGVSVTLIRGNHEEAILRAHHEGNGALKSLLERTNNESLLSFDGERALDPRWLSIMEESVYWVELPDAILVHGGVDMSKKRPFADGHALVSLRKTTYDARVVGHRPVIHGHTRRPLSVIIESLVTDAPVIPLDNGAVGGSSRKPYKISEYGNLCCLDLDRRTLHVQPSRDTGDDDLDSVAYSLAVHLAHPATSG